jgi:hypothetical protein
MSEWRRHAACRGMSELFSDRGHRHSALHICRFHCPVARECHAEALHQLNIEIVVGGRSYGAKGEVLDKTEDASAVLFHDAFCRELEGKPAKPFETRGRWRSRSKQKEAD